MLAVMVMFNPITLNEPENVSASSTTEMTFERNSKAPDILWPFSCCLVGERKGPAWLPSIEGV